MDYYRTPTRNSVGHIMYHVLTLIMTTLEIANVELVIEHLPPSAYFFGGGGEEMAPLAECLGAHAPPPPPKVLPPMVLYEYVII